MRLCAITDEISQDLGHALQVIQEYGGRDAELRNIYGKYIVDSDEDDLQRAKAELARFGMRVACIDTPFFKCDLLPTEAEATGPTHGARPRALDEQMHLLQRTIDLCKFFDAPMIRIFSFWRRGRMTPEIEEQIVAALVNPAQAAERAGVTLVLENEHDCFVGTGAEAARVIVKVGSPALKMVWDPGNAFMAGEQPYPSGYEAALPHIAHIHIKDAHAPEGKPPEWTIVGDGEIDFVGQFRALKTDGYTGAVSLETHYRGPDGDTEAASRKCLVRIKQLIETA